MNEQAAADPSPRYGVVVGDDGSPRALEAVYFAAEEARRRGVTLDVVRAWTIPTALRPIGIGPGQVPSTDEFDAATREFTEERIAKVVPTGTPPVRVHIVRGNATRALIEMSRSADILIVGDRGVGGFAGRLLGSTADAVIRESHCPVTVVRRPNPQ